MLYLCDSDDDVARHKNENNDFGFSDADHVVRFRLEIVISFDIRTAFLFYQNYWGQYTQTILWNLPRAVRQSAIVFVPAQTI